MNGIVMARPTKPFIIKWAMKTGVKKCGGKTESFALIMW